MSDPTFHPRDLQYKSPYGAVPTGTLVQFCARPPRRLGISKVTLKVQWEERANQIETIPMVWQGMEQAQDLFSCTLDTGEYMGLIWYSIQLWRLDQPEPQELGTFQLTVYDGKQSVPTWFGEGCTYQIFPDRFHRTRIPDPTGMVGGRQVHTLWEEEPEYRPNQEGEVRNRDFFGGNLEGIMEKLEYLHNLGVETLYFCPIFEAAENHRYGTADYDRIDPMLGSNQDFSALCEKAHQLGMRVMLDGVFNHTGYVSRYFNGDGFYPEEGACQSEDSPYRTWFQFQHWPDQYESWWGIYSLPAVNEQDPSYREFIFGGKDSVVRRWLRAGADGWRLDVADELPDDFVHGIHQAAREEKKDAVIIGEVWEDGSTKVAYGVRRKHILGGHCDGLMNYPFRNAALSYLMGGDARHFYQEMETLRENYPPFAFYSAMNGLSTHDTPRILTLLGTGGGGWDQSKDWRAAFRLSAEQKKQAVRLLKLGAMLLFAFPGSPTIYYGDEVGMEGFEDPFNRRTYPWGQEDQELLSWFTQLGQLRKTHSSLRRGDLRYQEAQGPLLAFTRGDQQEVILTALNRGEEELSLPIQSWDCRILMGGGAIERDPAAGTRLKLPPCTGAMVWFPAQTQEEGASETEEESAP